MKKLSILILAFGMLLALVACSKASPSDSSAEPTSSITETTSSITETTTTQSEGDSAGTTTTPLVCSHNWKAATCTAPKTCTNCQATEGRALGHKEVISPAKHATFSVAGLTEGAYCSVCKKVTKRQKKIPALGGDMVVGTDYYDKTGQTTYRYSYSFTLYDNDRFNLTTLKVGSDESYELTGEEGKLNYLNNGIYELLFDNGRDNLYGKFADGNFQFCNKDGSEWNEKQERPQGNAKIPITPRAGNSVYGYNDLSHNNHGASMQELYYRLFAACEAFVDNNETVKPVGGKYIIDRINLEYYVLTIDEAVAVWKVFYMENPRYYWLANTISLTGGVLNVCIDPAYASGAYRQTCDKAIDNLAAACSQKLTSGSQLQKAMAIHDFILGQMNYAYKKDGVTPQTAIWAHNLIGCAEKRSGVCESYAKAYQYLCRLNGMECIVVTGFNGQSHAWNVIKINGNWYGVDCTFDETGKANVSYNCFGMSASRMQEEYTADKPTNAGIDYLYGLPTLASRGIELVNLYKNNAHVGLYANIDAAFAAMTDTKSNYEIRLFRYDAKGVLLLSSAAVEHHITSAQTPKVKSLTLKGAHIDMGNDYYTSTSLFIDKKTSLQSDLTLYDLRLHGNGSLNLKNKKLSCLGNSAEFSVPITGSLNSASPSELHLGISMTIEFWKPLQVHTLSESENFNGGITIRENSTIIKAAVHNVSVYQTYEDNAHVQIKEFCPLRSAPYSSLDVHGSAKLTVEKITVPNEYMSVTMEFGKLNEFGAVSIGSSNTKVHLILNGQVSYSSTDMNGNEVGKWEESVNPKKLKVPIATLLDKTVMSKMKIFIVEWKNGAGLHKEYTKDYMLNSKNQVVLKKK